MDQTLRWGYTTGTCAAAASLAAALMLLGGKRQERVSLTTPKGICLELETEEIQMEEDQVFCAVRKDAGDDPDVTDGILIFGRVSRRQEKSMEESGAYIHESGSLRLVLTGGVGVGTVTKPGLSCEVGKPAINPVPRRMIFEPVEKVCREYGYTGSLRIEIYAPEGKERAERTFNPRLGIQGGISILGTSGIVEPMSEAALLETIRLELRQKHLEGYDRLILTPGNYGEAFLRNHLGIDLGEAVKCSNFIGKTLDMAGKEGIREVFLAGHGGKLIKVAAGIMNTHSSEADGRMEILAAYGAACGAGPELIEEILEAVTVDQGLALLERCPGLRERVMERVMERISFHIGRRTFGKLQAEVLVFTNERGILGMTAGAENMLEAYRQQMKTQKG